MKTLEDNRPLSTAWSRIRGCPLWADDALRGHLRAGSGLILGARGTGATLLAGVGHKHLVMAVGTADACKTFRQVATRKKSGHAAVDDESPETVLDLKPLIIDLPKGVKISRHRSEAWGSPTRPGPPSYLCTIPQTGRRTVWRCAVESAFGWACRPATIRRCCRSRRRFGGLSWR